MRKMNKNLFLIKRTEQKSETVGKQNDNFDNQNENGQNKTEQNDTQNEESNL